MIICDFDITGIATGPYEAYAPLIVDTYAVLTLALTFQGFQPVGGRGIQVVQPLRII